jgi:hypothetical protein
MKTISFSYRNMFSSILIAAVISCSMISSAPAIAGGKDASTFKSNDPEESQLVDRLINDHMIDQVKGFLVEKKQDKLFIDGKQQSNEIATKYLSSLKQDVIRVEVYPFMKRLQMHPDADLLQLITPVSTSSPCIQSTAKKPGC